MLLSRAFRDIVLRRRSVKRFDVERSVDAEVLHQVLAQTQRAPSGYNLQGWRCVLVRSRCTRQALGAPFLGNADKVAQAPVLALFFGLRDPYKEFDHLSELTVEAGAQPNLPSLARHFQVSWMTQRGVCDVLGVAKNLLTSVLRTVNMPTVPLTSEAYAWKQVAIAATTFICPMEGFDEVGVMKVLGINPAKYTMPIAFCVGYASPDEPERSPSFRLPPEELFFQESLDHPMEGIQPLVTFPGKDDKRPQEEVPQEGEQEEEGTHWDRPPQEHIMT